MTRARPNRSPRAVRIATRRLAVALAVVGLVGACGEDPRTPTPRLTFTFAPAQVQAGQPFMLKVDSKDVGVFEVLQGEERIGVVANPISDPLLAPGDFYTYIAKSAAVPSIRAFGDDGTIFLVLPQGVQAGGGAGGTSGAGGGGGAGGEQPLPDNFFEGYSTNCDGFVSITADTSERCEAEGGTVKFRFAYGRSGQGLLDVVAREPDGTCSHLLRQTSYGSGSLFEEVRAGNLIRLYELPSMTYVRTYELDVNANTICKLRID